MTKTIYDFNVKDIKGNEISLSSYKDYVILIVNTASKCGFTPQFEGLQSLYEKYKDKNFVVLGFPCNQFLAQDPLDNEQIASFCSLKYNVTFPMMSKIKVNGKEADALYQFLKEKLPGRIKWNFTKFLVDRNGEVVSRFDPKTTPKEIEGSIEKLI